MVGGDIQYEWDPEKAERTAKKHGVSFEKVEHFDWDTALVLRDDRFDYDQDRYVALGFIEVRLHALAFTHRGEKVRVVSLRKTTRQEIKSYERAGD